MSAFRYSNLWHWFGLSYSGYMVLPRVVLCDMPDHMQEKMLDILQYIEENYDTDKMPGEYMVKARDNGKFIKDPMANYRRFDISKYRKKPQITLPPDNITAEYIQPFLKDGRLVFGNKLMDTHRIYNTDTGRITVPVTGPLFLKISVQLEGETGRTVLLQISINDGEWVNIAAATDSLETSVLLRTPSGDILQAGDVIDLRITGALISNGWMKLTNAYV